MFNFKRFFFIITIFLCSTYLHAAFLANVPVTLEQPDGTELHLLASGDEFYNWLHDDKNFTIIQDPKNGYYVYAEKNNGILSASHYIVGKIDPVLLPIEPGLRYNVEHITQQYDFYAQGFDTKIDYRASSKGDLNNLVVFIRFKDQTEFPAEFPWYDDMFNEPNANSMYQYYKEMSYDQLFISSHFFPLSPDSLVIYSYQDSFPRSYYMTYNIMTNPEGYQNNQERTSREHTLLKNAILYISSQVPPDLDLDYNDDGLVDNVCFVIKGSSGAWTDFLWPHMWVLYTQHVYLNGARVYTYNFQLSEFMQSSGNGVLCHEMFHSLGAPDLYRYYNNDITPIGPWDLMAGSGNPPCYSNAFMLYKYGGWIDEIPLLEESGTYTLYPLTESTNNAYIIPSPNSTTEYFFVEYRKQQGMFESNIPNTGMLIYRINSTVNGNAAGPPDEMYVYRPNGTLYENGSISIANYCAQQGRTEINDLTNPSCFLSDGSFGGLFIHSITDAGDSISFTLENGLIALFESDLQQGPACLGVQFEALSLPDIIGWEWDFNGDGYIDSYEKNPYYIYEQPGQFDVTLRVTDGYDVAEITEENYISVFDGSDVSGSVAGVWKQEFNPYVITGQVNVAFNHLLSLEPGVEIRFDNNCHFIIEGQILAQGTVETPIIFHSLNQWKGIKINYSYTDNIIEYCHVSDATAGAIQIIDAKATIRFNEIYENSSITQAAASVDIDSADEVLIEGNSIHDNVSTNLTAGIACTNADPSIIRNLIFNNSSDVGSSIVMMDSSPKISNNTIVDNFANLCAIFNYNSSPVIKNSIFMDCLNFISIFGGSPSVSYCDIFGDYSGIGNMYEDPMFVDPINHDYHLLSCSPCIDAGDPTSPLDPDSTISDIGAYYYDQNVSVGNEPSTPSVTTLYQNYPNPIAGGTTFSFYIKGEQEVDLSIYNIRGQCVRSFKHSYPQGFHEIYWDGKDEQGLELSSGIYLMRLNSKESTIIRKMVLVRK